MIVYTGDQIMAALVLIFLIVGIIAVVIMEHYYRMKKTPLDARRDLNKILGKMGYRYENAFSGIAEQSHSTEKIIRKDVDDYLDEMKRLLAEYYRTNET